MADKTFLKITSDDESTTAALAGAIAPSLEPGDVILLEGDIGAGKSFFARNVIQARLAEAGLWEDVPSPTFTLVQTYEDGRGEIWHADLYRLSGAGDLAELGLDDAFRTAICLVEWPEKLGELTPEDALAISFRTTEASDTRILSFTGDAARWARKLAMLSENAGGLVG